MERSIVRIWVLQCATDINTVGTMYKIFECFGHKQQNKHSSGYRLYWSDCDDKRTMPTAIVILCCSMREESTDSTYK